MSFAEVRLDLGIDYGCVGGPQFSTTVIVDGSGAEQRNINWSQPLGRWQIGNRTGDRCLDKSELDALLAFHTARQGSLEGFRFKDWTDYRGVAQLLGVGNGIQTQFKLRKS
jgi:uncharacterized protein (TIGR02217 family)